MTKLVTASTVSRSVLNGDMFKAAATNDIKALQAAVRAGADMPEALNGQGQTVIEMARDRDLVEVVRWIERALRLLDAATVKATGGM